MTYEKKIDLKQRLSEPGTQSGLNGLVSFTTQPLNESNLNELAAIADRLDKVGISMEISRRENEETGLNYDFVVMKVNEEKYRAAMTRSAGRKADFNKKYDTYGKCTVEELQEKLKTTTKSDVARELGCSRMTLYRILKNISQLEPAGDTSIWHYTS